MQSFPRDTVNERSKGPIHLPVFPSLAVNTRHGFGNNKLRQLIPLIFQRVSNDYAKTLYVDMWLIHDHVYWMKPSWLTCLSVWTENCQRTTFFSASGPCAVGHMFISCFSQHPALRFSKRHFAHGLTRVISFSLIRDCLLLCTCEQAMQMCSTFRTHTLFLALLEYGIKRVTRPVPKSNKAPFYDSAFTGFSHLIYGTMSYSPR